MAVAMVIGEMRIGFPKIVEEMDTPFGLTKVLHPKICHHASYISKCHSNSNERNGLANI